MKVLIATDIALVKSHGRIYAKSKYATIFRRYHAAFGSIVFCSRVQEADEITKDCEEITEITERLVEVPSMMKTLLNQNNHLLMEAVKQCDLVISRCPGMIAYKAADCARKAGIPCMTESMGCAWDAYWNHGIAGKLIAPYMFLKMRAVVGRANYALYVTSEFLQKRYPRTGSSVAASNVRISCDDDSVLTRREARVHGASPKQITLMTTAAVDVQYKGQEYVIKAIPQLNQQGIRVRYLVVGEGDPARLKQIAAECKVADQVEFPGRMPLSQVLQLLDETDVYIQPSLQEGLPRSMIEAMSRGCICIGARTAGIPELIDDRFVVRRKSVEEVAKVVAEIAGMTAAQKQAVCARNYQEAQKYTTEVLDARRNAYFASMRQEIERARS